MRDQIYSKEALIYVAIPLTMIISGGPSSAVGGHFERSTIQ
ncbi:MAG: hypothetical protein AVDCRST_MAG93-2729 [uncultured Chloroflexia bacterium]|uniref:Uncharacterized protein n=1 Tax=uncultured Chloroflexia bacterium TaxID=1672391 RepID=A0A6J4JBC3_9CHLR|nr:MAG: hypothetical protein AVDCRST_MAG93-2729 [uncultured Chloroflexia bacterium]